MTSINASLDELALVFRSALVSDALDSLGRRHQSLGWDIIPISPPQGPGVMVGHAFPVAVELANAVPDVPYVGLLAALDAVSEGQVFVFPVDRGTEIAVWGELLSTACAHRGARGVLSDGMVRDVSLVREMGFPVFARGTLPVDINGRYEVVAHNVPARIDGVHVMPGDLIVGDVDGCVVVPQDFVGQVTNLVRQKTEGESEFRRAVAQGMSPSEAFAKFGVL